MALEVVITFGTHIMASLGLARRHFCFHLFTKGNDIMHSTMMQATYKNALWMVDRNGKQVLDSRMIELL
jgi:hypothetical protein